jgi:hypothetical protein
MAMSSIDQVRGVARKSSFQPSWTEPLSTAAHQDILELGACIAARVKSDCFERTAGLCAPADSGDE